MCCVAKIAILVLLVVGLLRLIEVSAVTVIKPNCTGTKGSVLSVTDAVQRSSKHDLNQSAYCLSVTLLGIFTLYPSRAAVPYLK